jgi:alkylation response protein AidB-like acyl-CoA dehydrogenase
MKNKNFPSEQVMKLAELGFLGMMVKPEYGGAGMDTVSYVLAMEEISKIDASTSVCMSVIIASCVLVCRNMEPKNKNKNILYHLPGQKGW